MGDSGYCEIALGTGARLHKHSKMAEIPAQTNNDGALIRDISNQTSRQTSTPVRHPEDAKAEESSRSAVPGELVDCHTGKYPNDNCCMKNNIRNLLILTERAKQILKKFQF